MAEHRQRSRRAMAGVAVLGAVAALTWWPDPAGREVDVAARNDAAASALATDQIGGIGTVRTVLHRRAADGTRITAVLNDYGSADRNPSGAHWTPPPECLPTGDLEVGLSNRRQTVVGWAQAYGSTPDGGAVRGGGAGGHSTLGAFLYAAVQADRDVTWVRLVLDGRVLDEMAPRRGWAVVAGRQRPTAQDEYDTSGAHVELVTAAGTAELPLAADQTPRIECLPPPPPLPAAAQPPGPDDTDAVAEIERLYEHAFAEPTSRPDYRTIVTGGDQLDDELLERVRILGENYADVAMITGAVGFVDDSTALVQFQLVGLTDWTIGEANLVDGEWRVSSQTFCHMISRSAILCPDTIWDPDVGSTRHTD